MAETKMEAAFRLNAPGVVARVIDGEAILIAFETGACYSARGSGAAIIDAILRSAPLSELVDAFVKASAVARNDVERGVLEFLLTLQGEGLVVPRSDLSDEASGSASPGAGLKFEPPVLEKYNDLADLLVLDPIHDVDALGWPAAKARGGPGELR